MSGLATRRLIDAAAALEPADRALLNMWVNRGLDDQHLSQLTGMSPESLSARRERIVGRLGEELGLPEGDVWGALTTIQPAPVVPVAAKRVTADPADNGAATPAAAPEATAPEKPEAPATGRRRRGRWPVVAGGAVTIGVAALIVALSSGGSTRHTTAAATPTARRSATTPASAPTATTPPPVVTAASPSLRSALTPLPGGLAHVAGSVALSGRATHLKLRLRVSGLPTAAQGGYHEVWLYNSVLDSQPLGRLPAGATSTAYALPGEAHRYRWIDVSFQPRGTVNHSGESLVRAANPAHAGAPHAGTGAG